LTIGSFTKVHWYCNEKQAAQVWDQEDNSSIRVKHVRETPDVTESDCKSNTSKPVLNLIRELVTLIHFRLGVLPI
jgi:hypothetical protein